MHRQQRHGSLWHTSAMQWVDGALFQMPCVYATIACGDEQLLS